MSRASFAGLPLEIKARIVEMVRWQEEIYAERIGGGTKPAGHINSLSSLALVNKELRELTAKHQFEVLYSDETSLPFYRFVVYPRHGHRITDLAFYDRASGDVDKKASAVLALSDLSHLPSVRSLYFQRSTAVDLFGPGVTLEQDPDNNETSYRAQALASVATRIETLYLHGFRRAEAVGLIRKFPNLQTLHLMALTIPEEEEDAVDLVAAISSLRKLESLTISLTVSSSSGAGWPIASLALLERDPPPVKHLQLLYFALDAHLLHILALFAPTLQKVTLSSLTAASDFSDVPPLALPRLVSLNLLVPEMSTVGDINRLLLASSSLRQLSIRTVSVDELDSAEPSFLALLSSQTNLRRLYFGELLADYPVNAPHPFVLSPSSLATYADLVHSRRLDPAVLDRPHLTPFHPRANLDYTTREAEHFKLALDRTLDFGKMELERMFAEGNVAKAVGWVAKLRKLEEERLAWKD